MPISVDPLHKEDRAQVAGAKGRNLSRRAVPVSSDCRGAPFFMRSSVVERLPCSPRNHAGITAFALIPLPISVHDSEAACSDPLMTLAKRLGPLVVSKRQGSR